MAEGSKGSSGASEPVGATGKGVVRMAAYGTSLCFGIVLLLGTLTLPGTARGAGQYSCNDVILCIMGCSQGNASCYNSCFNQAAAKSQATVSALQACLLNTCGALYNECTLNLLTTMETDCGAQYVACQGDSACFGTCDGKDCGDDGCGNSCGQCPFGTDCYNGKCSSCAPDCQFKDCGDNGCGGVCGVCGIGMICVSFQCVPCQPSCAGKQCGDNGCMGSCGLCGEDSACVNGKCVDCKPNCSGKACGADGCGGNCGDCPPGFVCTAQFQCISSDCTPDCLNKECGPDGCGGVCGVCPDGFHCTPTNYCSDECVPNCIGFECGDDGCGGDCGSCGEGLLCADGQCIDPDDCVPDCEGKECGSDGCGGSCGKCKGGKSCSKAGKCEGGGGLEPWDDEGEYVLGPPPKAENSGCPEGHKEFLGKCIPDSSNPKQTLDEGGCSTHPDYSRNGPGSIWWSILLMVGILGIGCTVLRRLKPRGC